MDDAVGEDRNNQEAEVSRIEIHAMAVSARSKPHVRRKVDADDDDADAIDRRHFVFFGLTVFEVIAIIMAVMM